MIGIGDNFVIKATVASLVNHETIQLRILTTNENGVSKEFTNMYINLSEHPEIAKLKET